MCYGYQEVATLCNLQDSGILRVRDKGFDWSDVKEVSFSFLLTFTQKFKLIEETYDIKEPKSYSYVLTGLKPLSVRFIELFIEKQGFKNIGNKSKYLPANPLIVMNLIPGENLYPDNEGELFQQLQNARQEKKKILLYFLGGVTFAEIGAIRFMNQQPNAKFRFVIATTQIINGNRAVSQMRSCVANNLDPLSISMK